MTQDPILRAMLEHRDVLDKAFAANYHAPFIRVTIATELEVLRRLEGSTEWPKVRQQYLTLMAICYRALRDQQLETLADAEQKETRV